MNETGNVRRERLALGAILFLTFLVYANTLGNGFSYDDRFYAAAYTMHGRNTMVVDDQPIGEYFTRPMGSGIQSYSRGFRPLTVLSYAWTHKSVRAPISPPRRHPDFPENPIDQEWTDPSWPHHLINVLLHVVATFLVYRIVRNCTGPGLASLGATAVFGLHALRSDPVCSIVGRGELLPFVFGATAMLSYSRALSGDLVGGARWTRLSVAMACLMAALLSKESAVAWVVMIPLYAALVPKKRELPGVVRAQVVPWLVVAAIPLLVFFLARHHMLSLAEEARDFNIGEARNELFGLSLLERLPTALIVWAYGLYKVLVPYPLAIDYSRRVFDIVTFAEWRVWVSALALFGILVGGLCSYRRRPQLFLAMATLLGFSLITSNIPVPVETIFSERLFYTPALGLSLVVAWGLTHSRRILPLIVCAWLACNIAICVVRTFDWRSNETLFEADADNQPHSLGLQMNMARVCRLRGDWDRRRQYLLRALAVDPDHYTALNDLAADLMDEGRFQEALPHLQQALRALQDKPVDMESMGPGILVNQGIVQQKLGQLDDALRSFQQVVDLRSARMKRAMAVHGAYLGLLDILWRRADLAAVGRLLARADPLFPGDPELGVFRGLLAHRKADHRGAVVIFDSVLPATEPSSHKVLGLDAAAKSCAQLERPADAAKFATESGTIHLLLDEIEPARVAFRAALAYERDHLDAYKGLLWAAWEVEDKAEVERLVAKALEIAPKDGEVWVHRGLLAYAAGDAATTERILSPTVPRLGFSKHMMRAWFALGDVLLQLGDAARARRLVQMMGLRQMPRRYLDKFRALKARIPQDSK